MSCARTAACAAKLMQGMTHSLVRDSRLVQRNVDLRKRGLLSDETKAVLEDWLEKNLENPHPSQEEKQRLARITSTPVRQVVMCPWFECGRACGTPHLWHDSMALMLDSMDML